MPRAAKSCANPLFCAWVQEFHDEKDYRKRGGPPRATGYENALRSIEACDTKYAHPKELLALSGVGPTCKLEEHCAHRGIPMPEFKKKERVKKTPAAAKKVVRRGKKQAEDEDSAAPSSSKAKAHAFEEDDDLTPTGSAAPLQRRALPHRAATRKVAVSVSESDSEY
ncbi:hypothetical protein B0H11DRAFT_2234944 [Mycena galericulata]|nr:hypothetical protein B0H11DRAFT_2234944 [Mycena galericulata]